jgi:hypothetical protein
VLFITAHPPDPQRATKLKQRNPLWRPARRRAFPRSHGDTYSIVVVRSASVLQHRRRPPARGRHAYDAPDRAPPSISERATPVRCGGRQDLAGLGRLIVRDPGAARLVRQWLQLDERLVSRLWPLTLIGGRAVCSLFCAERAEKAD